MFACIDSFDFSIFRLFELFINTNFILLGFSWGMIIILQCSEHVALNLSAMWRGPRARPGQIQRLLKASIEIFIIGRLRNVG